MLATARTRLRSTRVPGLVIQLIGIVRATTGLTVKAKLDTRRYPTGIKVSGAEMDYLLITRKSFHGEWNDTVHPRADNETCSSYSRSVPKHVGNHSTTPLDNAQELGLKRHLSPETQRHQLSRTVPVAFDTRLRRQSHSESA